MPKTKSKETGATVAETIKAIKDKYGDESIMKLNEKPKVGLGKIPTGSFGLDEILGIGGYPRGRMIEIYGPNGAGKTTLVLHAVAEAQKMGGVCAYMDAENAMDPEYAAKLGVKVNDLHISQPQSAEEALDMAELLLRSNAFDIIVIDSVAALTPQSEVEGEMGQQQMGKQARLLSQACRKLNSQINGKKTIVIFINQIRTSIGGMPGMPTEYTPGGKALGFYTSVRLDIRRIAGIKKGEDVVGNRVRVKVVKNKVGAPYKKTEFDLMYGEGISKEGEILALGESTGVIKKTGNSYEYNGEKLGRGYDASRQFLKANLELANEIVTLIKSKLAGAPTELETKADTSDEETTATE